MTTATLTRTIARSGSTTPTVTETPDRDPTVRDLLELHAHAGQLIAAADWSPDVEHAVHDLTTEIRRAIAEVSGIETFVPSTPGDGTAPVVRLRELGVLHRRLTGALRGSADPDPIHRATIRARALVGVLAGTLA